MCAMHRRIPRHNRKISLNCKMQNIEFQNEFCPTCPFGSIGWIPRNGGISHRNSWTFGTFCWLTGEWPTSGPRLATKWSQKNVLDTPYRVKKCPFYPTLKSGPRVAHKWAVGHSPASVLKEHVALSNLKKVQKGPTPPRCNLWLLWGSITNNEC